jgi:hypothetical protein
MCYQLTINMNSRARQERVCARVQMRLRSVFVCARALAYRLSLARQCSLSHYCTRFSECVAQHLR